MSETFNKFKKMMELAKKNQERFEKEMKRLDFEEVTPITQKDLDEAENHVKSLDEMNKENIDELNKVSISSVRSSSACLRDISRSLSEISKSLMNIEGYLTDNKEADWND
ncbi:hypothetical protein EGO58_01615 [Limosilactobacillus reuteri]|uniref:hypothetical protein n=1 Tax=Limosilactobacillus reuteri TaxID=1598 RepID=UPI000F4E8552|nr:hypothetical protein [Limosilactobacillus reuteri]MDZ5437939.1 hypothetical protein [Limosilactobacillus reuteri]ROV63938.1 hypothetical protein EGO58_01615 [Limosilactobacillus reuteri]